MGAWRTNAPAVAASPHTAPLRNLGKHPPRRRRRPLDAQPLDAVSLRVSAKDSDVDLLGAVCHRDLAAWHPAYSPGRATGPRIHGLAARTAPRRCMSRPRGQQKTCQQKTSSPREAGCPSPDSAATLQTGQDATAMSRHEQQVFTTLALLDAFHADASAVLSLLEARQARPQQPLSVSSRRAGLAAKPMAGGQTMLFTPKDATSLELGSCNRARRAVRGLAWLTEHGVGRGYWCGRAERTFPRFWLMDLTWGGEEDWLMLLRGERLCRICLL